MARYRREVAIRPAAKKLGVRSGYSIYLIAMKYSPLEDLYLGPD